MNNQQSRIEWATDLLLDAYNSRTLAKGVCTACAVGNIVAKGMGVRMDPGDILCKSSWKHGRWGLAFRTDVNGIQSFHAFMVKDSEVASCIQASRFSLEELMLIEKTYERATKIDYEDYRDVDESEVRIDQLNGLKAVIEVIATFPDSLDQGKKQIARIDSAIQEVQTV